MANVDGMRSFLEHKKKLDDVEKYGTEKTSEETYEKEFAKIRDISQGFKTEGVYPFAEGTKTENEQKNRYKDIVPFDHCRVTLKHLKDGSTSDYINASFMKGPSGEQTYIAAQGPLPNTVDDFWQMIWENNVKVMIMACQEYEDDPPKLKCQRYWPNSTSEEMTFGDVIVTLEKEEKTEYEEHVIRHMIARIGSEKRPIVQYHHCNWHDKGAIDDVRSIVHLIEKMRERQPVDSKNTPPVLIHCSAGCGRTGSVLVIDFVMSLLKTGKIPANFRLFDVIVELRRQRMAIVQSLSQYVFVHEVASWLFDREPLYGTLLKTNKKREVVQTVSRSRSGVEAVVCTYGTTNTLKPTVPPPPKRAYSEGEGPKVVTRRPLPIPKPSALPIRDDVSSAVVDPGKGQINPQIAAIKPTAERINKDTEVDRPHSGKAALLPRRDNNVKSKERNEYIDVTYETLDTKTNIGLGLASLSGLAQVVYNGVNISYPNRLGKHPRGKRELGR